MQPIVERAYHHGDLRAALLVAARNIVEEQGADTFTLREAARRAGVSHGAPAHHFGDKTGLLTALAAQVMLDRVEQVEAAQRAAGSDPLDQLKACGMAHIDFLISHPRLGGLCWRDNLVNRADPALQEVLQHMTAALIEGDLAESWKSSSDGKQWTFSLRKGVQCHHGYGEFTADDVVTAPALSVAFAVRV